MLSPMHLITKMRDHLNMKGEAVTSKQAYVPGYLFGTGLKPETGVATMSGEVKPLQEVSLIGDVITEQEIWACTTCRNCEDQCPVMNEHVDKVIDLRRHLVMMEGNLPAEAQRALTNIERQSNPWGINRNERSSWRELRDNIYVPTVQEEPQFEYLYFVGSMASFDNRSIKIAHSFTRLMNEAGVKFAILGNEEKNSGDTARRLGNEFLFQELAKQNIEIFHKYKVTKIVTTDPHAYNTFKNEYPEFGLTAEVYHHTEVLSQWLAQGFLQPTIPVRERLTYHDSCYLGRYNGVYEQPRDILKAIPGIELVEMERNRENAMCCGAGGGMMWTEETEGSRVNVSRVEQALDVLPTMIASACPYCLTMLSDGIKVKEAEHQVKTKDIAEILEASIEFVRIIKGKSA
jgi:Fe-S oxidoreductase